MGSSGKTYLEWYKDRMKHVLNPENYSLMSSCVAEPWDLLERHRAEMPEMEFMRRYRTSNAYGLPSLIQRICTNYRIPEERLLTTQGVTSAIFLLSTTLLEKKDTVLVEAPGYQPLSHSPSHCGAQITSIRRHPDRPIASEDLEPILDNAVRLIVLTDLHNPTGRKMEDEELDLIVAVMKQKSPRAYLILDEIYRDFHTGSVEPAALRDDRIISTSSLTKVYGFSVLRCGWIVAAPDVIAHLRKVQILMSGIGSRYLETLSSIVFDHLDEHRDRAHRIVGTNRKVLSEVLQPMIDSGVLYGSIPEWGCVYFPRIPGLTDTTVLTDYLEQEFGLYCVPGVFFGASDHVRIGYGEIDPDRLGIALEKFREGLTRFMQFH